MPIPLAAALLGVAITAGFVRVVSAAVGRGQRGGRMRWWDIVVASLGTLGLVLHCTAMFDRELIRAIPGGVAYEVVVNDLGIPSIALYVIPAALVLVGVRRAGALPLVVLGATLVAVGVTMYDRGPLVAHLAAITAAVVVLAGVLALRTPVRQSGRAA